MTIRWTIGALTLSALVACSGGSNNSCGDGDRSASEACDDGNKSNGDGCSSMCTVESEAICGDGTIFVATEKCDDGNTVSGDGCSSTCQSECGNGQLDGVEACDDGNPTDGDGCDATCIVEDMYTCTGEPSDCIKPTGACADPYVITFANNNGTLQGMGTGDTSTSTNQVPQALCDIESFGGFNSGAAKDHIWQFTIMDSRDVTVTVTGAATYDASIRMLLSPCDQSTEVEEYAGVDGCSDSGSDGDSETLGYTALPAGTYYVIVDGYDATEVGTYNLTVTAAVTLCGNGMLDGIEVCDDGNTVMSDGCSGTCDTEAGYDCGTLEPSVCVSACGNGVINAGEECDDDNTVAGDRCSPTCLLEYDTLEAAEPNNTTAQVVTASNHIIRGELITADDVDLYTFTLTAPSTVELQTYEQIDLVSTYSGRSTILTKVDCNNLDTELRLFNATGDVTMDATALITDDEDGDFSCSYIGANDSSDDGVTDTTQAVLLPAGTYTIKVNSYLGATAAYYLLDLNISSSNPAVPPVAGDLVLNEFIAADNASDTNCDMIVTGTNDEFIELVNVSSKVLDLTGVTIADSVVLRHTFAPGTTGSMILDPGKSIVVWGGGAPACTGVTNWFVASSLQLGLNDAGDTITVKDANMVQLIQVVYPAATLNVSRNLSPDVTGTTYANHNLVTGAVGNYSPGKRANGTAF